MDSAAFHAVSHITAFPDFKQLRGCRKDAHRWHRKSHALDATVVIAVIAVRMVQVPVHQVVGVVAVGNCRVAAVRAVFVALLVTATFVAWRASGRVRRVDGQGMFLDGATVPVVQMAVVQIIDMALVQDAGVPAVRAVLMSVIFVVSRHVNLFLPE